MVSRVLEGVLKSYLGQYLELSDSSVSMGSEIRLNNVKLKESALSDLGLPVKCVHGKVSKLVIKIPWFHLFSDKTVIEVEGLHLLVVPSTSVKYDEEKERRLQNEAKQKRLQRTEEAKRLEQDASELKDKKAGDGSDDTFVERLVANIIKNLEVSIKKVHIRYEDKQMSTGRYPFAAGVTLEHVQMTTTKDDSKEQKDKIKLKVFEKFVVLDSFSVYWKPKASMYSEENSSKEDVIDVMFNTNIGTRENPIKRLKYLLGPITSDASLTWCPDPTLYQYKIPEIDLSIQMKELCLSLTKYQYQDFMMLLQSFEFMNRASKFRKYKARHDLENLPNYHKRFKDLWKFAFDCVYEEEVMRAINNWSWDHMKKHINRCKDYRELYKRKIMAGTKVPQDLSSDLKKYEDVLDEVNIRIQRQLAEREVEKSAKEKIAAAAANAGTGFWGWFGGGGAKKSDQNSDLESNVKKLEEAMTSEEKEKLYEIIDYQENAHHGIFPKSFVARKLGFHLDCLLITIRDDDLNDAEIIRLNLSDVSSHVSQRPSADYVELAMTMRTLTVVGYEPKKERQEDRPCLVSTRPGSKDGNLVNFSFENNPPEQPDGNLDEDQGSVYDQRLNFYSSPLEIVYHATTINRLMKIFRTPDDLNLASLQHSAISKLNEYKQSTTLGLQYVIENHNLVDVKIELMSSYIILPHEGKMTSSCACAIANLGSIKIRSQPISTETRDLKDMSLTDLTETFKKSLRDQAYDKFIVTLEDMQVIVALPHEEWRAHVDRESSPLFLLKPTSLEVVFQYCLIKKDPEMPLTKIKGSLKEISINISDYRLIKMAQILDSLVDCFSEDNDPSLHRTESEGSMASAYSSLANTGSLVEQAQFVSTAVTDIVPAKRNDEIDTDSIGTLSHVTKMVLDFTINKVNLSLTQMSPSSNTDQELFHFTIHKMAIHAKVRMFDITGEFRISDVNCEHLLLKTPTGKPVHILSTHKKGKNEAKLLTLRYTDVNKKSPEFQTIHQNVLKTLEVELSQVDINLHQDAILDIIGKVDKFVKELSTKAKNLMAAPANEASHEIDPDDQTPEVEEQFEDARSPKPGEDVPDAEGALKRQNARKSHAQGTKRQTSGGLTKWAFKTKKRANSIEHQTIDVKVKASLEGVSFDFMTNKVYFASMRVEDLNVSYMQTFDQKVITAKLVNFEVMDACNLGSDRSKTIYEKIAENLDDKVFDASVTIYEVSPEAKANNPDVIDVLVEAQMGRVKVVFLMKFITDFLTFIEPFSGAREAVAEKATMAFDNATKSMIDAYANATRAQLNIMMDAPLIIIPVHSTSRTTFIADLGKLKLSNKFCLSDSRVFDQMHFDLKDLKLLRGRIAEDIRSNDIESDCLIIRPITFELDLVRNMNGSKDENDPAEISVRGTLKRIWAEMSKGDYDVLMGILLNNFSQKGEFEQVESSPVPTNNKNKMKLNLKKKHGSRTSLQSQRSSQSMSAVLQDPERHPKAKVVVFEFDFEGFQADIFAGDTTLDGLNQERDSHFALARLKVELIRTKGCLLVDGSISALAFLENCVLEDSRFYEAEADSNRIVRLMEAKQKSSDGTSKSIRMVDVNYDRDDKGNQILNAHVQSFVLVGSVAYLLEIAQFFVPDQTLNYEWSRPDLQVQAEQVNDQNISVCVKVDEPDIFLVENIKDINTDALMLNTELQFKFWSTSDSMSMMAALSNIRCHTCRFNPDLREETMAQILKPCTLSFTISKNEGHGMRVNVNMSDLCLNVSPYSIIIIQNSVQAFIDSMGQKERMEKKDVAKTEDLTELWRTKPFEHENFWFLKPDQAQDALELSSSISSGQGVFLDEQAILNINNLVIKVESGAGNNTIPLVLLESSFNCDIKNWSSSKMSATGTLNLEVAYYNAKLALWEPVIEPVCQIKPDGSTLKRRWDLNLSLQSNSSSDFGSIVASPSFDQVDGFVCPENLPPLMVIGLESKDILEVTLTKSFMGVLTTLVQSFADVTESKKKELPQAPFIVQNRTGKKLTLVLSSTHFRYFVANERPGETKTKELEHGQDVNLIMSKNRSQSVTQYVSPLQEQNENAEAMLKIKIEGEKDPFDLPVSKADSRFFPFPFRGDEMGDHHGLVSDIKVENGCKYITIRSVIQIKNHFDMPVNVLKYDGHSKYIKLAQLQPDENFDVPLQHVYSDPYEYSFQIAGDFYLGPESFKWRELVGKDGSHSQMIECRSKEGDQTIFLNVEGSKEPIFYERTGNLASMNYVLDIRPILVFKNCLPVTLHYGFDEFKENMKYIEPGQSGHMQGVKLGVSKIHLKIFEFRNADWECTQTIDERMPELSLWRFHLMNSTENSSAKFDLGINSMISSGTQVISIYAPFWMINKTGKSLTYRGQDPQNVIYHPLELEGVPMMFSYTAKSFLGKRKASIRIEESQWSDPFTLDTIEDAGKITCKKPEARNDVSKAGYSVGVNIAMSKSSLTKIITITPYYMIINTAEFPISVKELEGESWLEVPPGECVPFWPMYGAGNVIIRVSDHPEGTPSFPMTSAHSTLLMIANKFGALHADVRTSNSETLLTVSAYTKGLAPVLLINNTTNYMMKFWEKDVNKDEGTEFLPPMEQRLFTWLNPAGPRTLIWAIDGFKDEYVDKLVSDDQGVIEIDGQKEQYVGWVSFLNGMQRVLLFDQDPNLCFRLARMSGENERIDQEIVLSISGIGISIVNNNPALSYELIYSSITSSDVVWEVKRNGKTRFKPLTRVQCDAIESDFQLYLRELSVNKRSSVERIVKVDGRDDILVNYEESRITKPFEGRLARQFQKGLWVQLRTSSHQRQIHAKINRVQIDNQVKESLFPVILAPVPPPKSVVADSIPKPFIEMSVLQYFSPEHTNLTQYKYVHALVQELHIKVDQGLVNALIDLLEEEEILDEDIHEFLKEDLELATKPLKDIAKLQVTVGLKDFYDYLHLSPLKVHVSFSLTSYEAKNKRAESRRSNFFGLFLQSLGVTITDTDDIVFKLAYFERKHHFYSQEDLMYEMIRHYTSQAIKQAYVIIFGLDVIGNPFGLVVGVSRSVEDLFYEPFQGAVEGPSEFAEGLVIGVRSVFSGVIGGAAGTFSRITGAFGKGLASLTFDDKFQQKRREAIKKRGKQTVGESLARGGKGLVMGFFDGVTGVATKPIEGARDEGFGGFFKGMGKGVVGLVTRPTGGMIDFASGTFDSLKRCTDVGDELSRVRPARFIQLDGVVRNYNLKEATGNKILMELDKGRYAASDHYIAHEEIVSRTPTAFLVTTNRVLYVYYNQMMGHWVTEWFFDLNTIDGPPPMEEESGHWCLVIKPKNEERKKFLGGLFGGDRSGKKVFLSTRETVKNMARTIEALRRGQN
ncbi:hypothetical protein TCAL_09656 [Tigriopus californicus]|uniref:UBA domain-containing protein n=1 Tax=Tigriopus californicus TaxID=6832 RepID=A0A553NUH0_TIGCA|nr:intermembrane lipid transfer protein Vps13-like [Tigriopus californicus]TRY69082.1 hypothetical protein TCAL_09656 [Tigriopus californicus]|eukprot:TCALIF_09656-PA protein Name:"Similar to VPS13A Vacuolar protein sorting-associated protein 13A (Homo sapiens)" AED:0.10 eAED:0.10 QI:0/-1/0/1/-1/1/1/0/3343